MNRRVLVMESPEQDLTEGTLVDIVVEDQHIRCRKSVLIQESDYFRAMFNSNMCESQSNMVTLQAQKYQIVSKLVHCMETGELQIADDVKDLIETAVMFQVPSALTSCVSFLRQTIDDSNCLSIMKLASTLCIHSLYSTARRHALYFFNKVCLHEEFLELPVQDIVDYLSDRQLNCCSEVAVLKAIRAWNEFDSSGREGSLGSVLSCFHAEDLLTREWAAVRADPMLTGTDSGRAWLQQPAARDGHTTCENQYRSLPVMFVSVGGQNLVEDETQLCTDIGCFSETERKFVTYQSLKDVYRRVNAKMGFSVTVLGKDLYLSGGLPVLTRAKFEMNVWRFDSFEESWEVVTQVRSGRRHQGTCASETCLFLLGGFNKFRDILDTFEAYNTIADTWHDFHPMPERQVCPKSCYHDNKLYLSTPESLYVFDFSREQWSQLLNKSFALPVIWDSCIYNFKHVDEMEEMSWFGNEENEKPCEIVSYDLDSREEHTVQSTSKLYFGNEVVVSNRRFYMLQCTRNDLVTFTSTTEQEVDRVDVLGGRGVAGYGCRLLVLPCYPEYKVP